MLARFLSIWAGTPFPIDLVTSDSMRPTLWEGDIVAWTPTRIQDVEVGDVIVFKSYVHWPDEKILVHRVSNVTTNNKGEIRLETKGDANEWTDQAGPHIPEQYIRKDNLMGKVISIDNYPLKIPFIGIVGIWINEGLDVISQPTSSKGTLNYAGVFAPLTISIVILVILLFLIPEKAKTIREKIRINVFGRKPLNLKKTFIVFLIAYIVFFSFIHLFAYDVITTSVGVETKSPNSGFNFGRAPPGGETYPKDLQLLNPSTMPVKGVVFSKGNISSFITKKIFSLEKGEEKTTQLKAIIPAGTISRTYGGEIFVYSSPFWLLFPDEFMGWILEWSPEISVFILDLLSGIILTGITILILLAVSFFSEKISVLIVDRSWHHPSRLILKDKFIERSRNAKKRIVKGLGNSVGFLIRTDISKGVKKENFLSIYGKSIVASLTIIPVVFLVKDQITAMILSVIIAGIVAYMISCKLRNKIIVTVLMTLILAIVHMMIISNIIIIEKQVTILEMMALSFGAIGIYLLILAIFLLPLMLVSWLLARGIRNLKERKDPLLSLEGGCDL